eukprot:11140738-Karenia_brevis.AAC.1
MMMILGGLVGEGVGATWLGSCSGIVGGCEWVLGDLVRKVGSSECIGSWVVGYIVGWFRTWKKGGPVVYLADGNGICA